MRWFSSWKKFRREQCAKRAFRTARSLDFPTKSSAAAQSACQVFRVLARRAHQDKTDGVSYPAVKAGCACTLRSRRFPASQSQQTARTFLRWNFSAAILPPLRFTLYALFLRLLGQGIPDTSGWSRQPIRAFERAESRQNSSASCGKNWKPSPDPKHQELSSSTDFESNRRRHSRDRWSSAVSCRRRQHQNGIASLTMLSRMRRQSYPTRAPGQE